MQCSNIYFLCLRKQCFCFSLFLSPCVGFWATAGTYTVIIYTQREQLPLLRKKALRPLFHSFSPSLAFIFLSCWHPSILSAVLSLQFFVSVFHSVSFVFFFLSVIHLCPLPSPSRNIKKTTMREHFKHALFIVKVIFTCRQHGSIWHLQGNALIGCRLVGKPDF